MKTILPITTQQHARLVELADGHARADEYLQGTGYQFRDGVGACSVGCTIHDAKREGFCNGVQYDDHVALATLLGATEYMTRMQDNIFEGLPKPDAKLWTPRFLRALVPGVDYSSVATRMSIAVLRDEQVGLAHKAIMESVRAISELIAALYARRLAGNEPAENEWDAARQQADAAWHQADAAWHQADAAWQQADAARHQADAAWQQADAARQQAYAARQQAYAAWQQADAAWQQLWVRCADLMIEAMGQCK